MLLFLPYEPPGACRAVSAALPAADFAPLLRLSGGARGWSGGWSGGCPVLRPSGRMTLTPHPGQLLPSSTLSPHTCGVLSAVTSLHQCHSQNQ